MTNKLAVITGAASGIGLALAKACILEGMNVVMVDVAECLLGSVVDQLRVSVNTDVVGMVYDVSDPNQVKQLATRVFQKFNHIDLLINNAGISGPLAPIWELDLASINQVLDVNLYGVIHCVHAFLPRLLEQMHPSHIVNMASFYGLCSGSQMAAYAMSKHAIVALSESLYFDLHRLQKPIAVSVVCPSFTNTNLMLNSEPTHAPQDASDLYKRVGHLMARSRPAEDVATSIMKEIKHKMFYILPDKEVKGYYEQRAKAIIHQTMPHEHSLEKIFNALSQSSSTIDS